MHHSFKKLAETLAAVALAAGLIMAGTGTARADVVPPANTWAEIFAPEINASGITLCAGVPEYRISNVGSSLCIGLDPNRVNANTIAGSNLVQESCVSNLTIWELVPATDSPDPNNQFMLVNVWGALFHPQYAMEANTFLDQNGNRLIAEPESIANSAQWYALG